MVRNFGNALSCLFQLAHVCRTLSQMRQDFLYLAAGRLLLGRASVCQDYLFEVAGSLGLPPPHKFSSSTQAALEPHLIILHSLYHLLRKQLHFYTKKLRPHPRRSSYSTCKRAILFLDLLYCAHNTLRPIWVRPKVVVCSPAERLALREVCIPVSQLAKI